MTSHYFGLARLFSALSKKVMCHRACSNASRRLGTAVAVALSLGGGSAIATPAISSFNNGSIFASFNGTNNTVGWKFTVGASTDITVYALGWWDQSPGTSLAASHQVGIWDMSGTLLASTTVGQNDALNGAFRYSGIGGLNLSAGTSYLIGGTDSGGDGDNYTTGVSALVMDAMISFDGAAVNSAVGFNAPTTISNNSGGRFGPNFEFRARSTDVPEPASLALVGLALAGLGASRRKRQA